MANLDPPAVAVGIAENLVRCRFMCRAWLTSDVPVRCECLSGDDTAASERMIPVDDQDYLVLVDLVLDQIGVLCRELDEPAVQDPVGNLLRDRRRVCGRDANLDLWE